MSPCSTSHTLNSCYAPRCLLRKLQRKHFFRRQAVWALRSKNSGESRLWNIDDSNWAADTRAAQTLIKALLRAVCTALRPTLNRASVCVSNKEISRGQGFVCRHPWAGRLCRCPHSPPDKQLFRSLAQFPSSHFITNIFVDIPDKGETEEREYSSQ